MKQPIVHIIKGKRTNALYKWIASDVEHLDFPSNFELYASHPITYEQYSKLTFWERKHHDMWVDYLCEKNKMELQ